MQYFGNTVCSKKFMCNVRKCVNIRRNARIQMNGGLSVQTVKNFTKYFLHFIPR